MILVWRLDLIMPGEQLRSMDREFETAEPLRDRNKELPAKKCIIYNIYYIINNIYYIINNI